MVAVAEQVARNQARAPRNIASVQVGAVRVDSLRMSEAVDAIEQLITSGRGGAVFTPNVDHVVQAEHDRDFRDAYARAELSLADGMPVVWASRWMGKSLPERVSGSDLFEPLMRRAAERGFRVFLLGGAPGVAAASAEKLEKQMGVRVCGIADPHLPTKPTADVVASLSAKLREARPDIVIVAMGAPKQELWIDALKDSVRPAAMIGLGATLDFFVGRVQRAPMWMRKVGLEWLGRLLREPTRLWRRYLVRDPAFFSLVFRQQWKQRALNA